MSPRIDLHQAAHAAAQAAHASQRPTAAKTDRNPSLPYVPVIRHRPPAGQGRAWLELILGYAYATRADATAAAADVLRRRTLALADALLEPRNRALREHHGLPQEI